MHKKICLKWNRKIWKNTAFIFADLLACGFVYFGNHRIYLGYRNTKFLGVVYLMPQFTTEKFYLRQHYDGLGKRAFNCIFCHCRKLIFRSTLENWKIGGADDGKKPGRTSSIRQEEKKEQFKGHFLLFLHITTLLKWNNKIIRPLIFFCSLQNMLQFTVSR